jgi:hypothetical protein
MYNPFRTALDSDAGDCELVETALAGKRKALEDLVKKHQGWIFNIAVRMTTDFTKAEDITPANFRKILSRARRELYEFMNRKCGLLNKKARCQCKGKVMPHIRSGRIQPGKPKFGSPLSPKVKDVVERNVETLNRLTGQVVQDLHREHPFYAPPGHRAAFQKNSR